MLHRTDCQGMSWHLGPAWQRSRATAVRCRSTWPRKCTERG